MALSAEDKAEMLALLKAAREEERKDPEYQNSLKALVSGIVEAKTKVDPKKPKGKVEPVVEDDDVDLVDETDDEPTAAPAKPAKKSAAQTAEDKKQAERLRAVEKQLADAQRIAAQERQAREAQVRTAQIRDALAAAGVPADRLAPALAVLQTQDVVKTRDDGSLYSKAADKYGVEVDASIETGIKEWVNGPTGKLFMPPVQVRDAGGVQKGNLTRNKDGALDPNALKGTALTKIAQALGSLSST